jgi:hypothetical protein
MEKFTPTDRVAWLGFAVWIVCSAYFAISGDANMFGRMGAVAVAVAAAYYVAINLPTPAPIGQIELNNLNHLRYLYVSRSLLRGRFNQTYLSRVLVRELEVRGEAVPEYLRSLASIEIDKMTSPLGDEHWNELEAKNSSINADVLAADALVKKVVRFSTIFQTVVIFIGNIQWGFGDLLVNKLKLCGDWTC